MNYEQEEEYLTNDLSRKLAEARAAVLSLLKVTQLYQLKDKHNLKNVLTIVKIYARTEL